MPAIDVLIPNYERPEALAVTLTALLAQELQDFRIIIADQSQDEGLPDKPPLSTVIALHRQHGREVLWLRNLPRRGMAQQREFLLEHSTADYCLMLDSDVILEPFVLQLMFNVLQEQGCGFVGQGLIGLSFTEDFRPEQQGLELWEGKVQPETVTPDSPEWQRYRLHNAANVLHAQQKLGATVEQPLLYKLAWAGGCVLYDRQKLLEAGGFAFWEELPPEHAGEDVLAQLRVMKRFGGCGILPSGAYHQELPTTITERKVDAPKWLKV